MKYILVALLLLIGLTSSVQSQVRIQPLEPLLEMRDNTLIIKDDKGGGIAAYMIRYTKMRVEKTKLAIDGECDSSCTLFFGYLPQQSICVTENAKLGFHRSNRAEGTTVMMMNYPQPIILWLMVEGLTEDIKYLPEELLHALFPKCPDTLINPPKGEKID